MNLAWIGWLLAMVLGLVAWNLALRNRKLREVQLAEARKLVEQSLANDRLRSDFVANVSHELKTPLTAIRASLETLESGALEDPSVNRDFVSKALNHTHRLSALIDDLLTLSAIEERQRQGTSPRSSGSMARGVHSAMSLLEHPYKNKEIVLVTGVSETLPLVVMDDSSLAQVLTNLLDNACKYSPGGTKVQVEAGMAGESVLCSVKDQGPGIPEADLPRIFERFYRVDKARSRELGSTGLGLSIVKHLVEGAGGQVGVESEVGKGTTFWFKLPAAPAN